MKPLLFLHTAKTGGSSLRKALITNLKDSVCPDPSKNSVDWHAPLEEVKKVFNLEDYFVVTIVRCPFRRAISYYEADKQIFKTEQGATKLTFNEFYSEKHRSWLVDRYFLPCWNYARVANYIIWFDTLEQNFKDLCSFYNIDLELPHVNKTEYSQENLAAWFNDETRQYIERRFADDIRYLNYSFDNIGK